MFISQHNCLHHNAQSTIILQHHCVWIFIHINFMRNEVDSSERCLVVPGDHFGGPPRVTTEYNIDRSNMAGRIKMKIII